MKLTLLVGLTLCSLAASATAAADKPQIQYVGAVTINTSKNTKVLADWYAKFFGAETALDHGVYWGTADTATGPMYFSIHPREKGAPKKSSASVSIVFHVSDYKGYVSTLESNGLKPEKIESDPNVEGTFANYRDPDGNQVTVWGK